MGVKHQKIEGTKIINEIDSTNIVKTTYDTADNSLVAEFKNGTKYEYEQVPHNVYAEFRLSESQGKYFNSKYGKKGHVFCGPFSAIKIKSNDVKPIKSNRMLRIR